MRQERMANLGMTRPNCAGRVAPKHWAAQRHRIWPLMIRNRGGSRGTARTATRGEMRCLSTAMQTGYVDPFCRADGPFRKREVGKLGVPFVLCAPFGCPLCAFVCFVLPSPLCALPFVLTIAEEMTGHNGRAHDCVIPWTPVRHH